MVSSALTIPSFLADNGPAAPVSPCSSPCSTMLRGWTRGSSSTRYSYSASDADYHLIETDTAYVGLEDDPDLWSLPGAVIRDDRVLGPDDLEGPDGGDWL